LSKEELKKKYNEPILYKTVGTGFLVTGLIIATYTYYEFNLPIYLNWIIPWGFLGTCLIEFILVNTICKKK